MYIQKQEGQKHWKLKTVNQIKENRSISAQQPRTVENSPQTISCGEGLPVLTGNVIYGFHFKASLFSLLS